MDKKEEIKQWFNIAEKDLVAAEQLIKTSYPILSEIVCFHCQQSAEKYLKGFLAINNIVSPKIHVLMPLLQMCETIYSDFSTLTTPCAFLTNYSILPRYPNELQITDNDARIAVQYAKKIQELATEKLNDYLNSMTDKDNREFPSIQLIINGEKRQFDAPITVLQLLEMMELKGKPIAVERNLTIVSFRQYAETTLEDGDSLEIVTLVGGG
ncbi:MAG: sulfur carrier protein ThiS [Planctomycetaceae bacterium]|jgi:thiamine biosynthesis protein ThiS|nr:sulfur carrier protein ThiS [Planctomycetaceae bacterium]